MAKLILLKEETPDLFHIFLIMLFTAWQNRACDIKYENLNYTPTLQGPPQILSSSDLWEQKAWFPPKNCRTFYFMIQNHHYFMAKAFQQAELAFHQGEVPVGAIVVHNGRIIGKGYNQTEMLQDPTAHAEIIAISAACEALQNKYLHNCTLYVTLEPCPMCSGAIVWAKLSTLVFAALDEKSGGAGSVFNITSNKTLNHSPEVIHGIMENESQMLLRTFFRQKRDAKGIR